MPNTSSSPDKGAAAAKDPKEQISTTASLKQRFSSACNSRVGEITDDDLKKYTGRTRAEIKEWAAGRPGVGANRPAGRIEAGAQAGAIGWHAGEKSKRAESGAKVIAEAKVLDDDSDYDY